jgi:hypothetical protein
MKILTELMDVADALPGKQHDAPQHEVIVLTDVEPVLPQPQLTYVIGLVIIECHLTLGSIDARMARVEAVGLDLTFFIHRFDRTHRKFMDIACYMIPLLLSLLSKRLRLLQSGAPHRSLHTLYCRR